MNCSQCGGRIKNITIRDCDERCKTKRRYSGGPTPTPPDSQVVEIQPKLLRGNIEVTKETLVDGTAITAMTKLAESQLAEPKVLEFELRPHSEYEGYKAFLCTKLQYGGCPLFEDNFATKEQAEEAANAIAASLGMVAEIKEVEDGS